MAFVPVPKDLNRVKTKVMFNLTKRQLICFSVAAAVGVPIFFLAKAHLDLSTAARQSKTATNALNFFIFGYPFIRYRAMLRRERRRASASRLAARG